MNEKPWRLFKRPARWRRRFAVRGEQYDGSRWELHKRYKSKKQAEDVRDNFVESEGVYPMFQYKIMHQSEGRP